MQNIMKCPVYRSHPKSSRTKKMKALVRSCTWKSVGDEKSQYCGVSQYGFCEWLDGGEYGIQCSWTEKVRDGRKSGRCDGETRQHTHMSEVGVRKESI
jgi:hypothetical protein